MTLVVARRMGQAIAIVSDTHLTEELASVRGSPHQGAIKSMVVTPFLTVNFAGNLVLAGRAVQTYFKKWHDRVSRPELIANFVQEHLQSDRTVDFILAFSHPAQLVSIKDGVALDCDSAWIGDQMGFETFQRVMLSGGEPNQASHSVIVDLQEGELHPELPVEFLGSMRRAMQIVIDDVRIPSVRGFVVTVGSKKSELRYTEYFHTQTTSLDLVLFDFFSHVPFGMSVMGLMPIGNAAQGQYSMYFTFAHNYLSCFPVMYFVEGKFGVVYFPTREGTLRPKIFQYPSYEAFLDGMRENTPWAVISGLKNHEKLTGFVEKS